MSDELRAGLRAAADEGGGSRPDVADLWRTGRRRRTARRVLGATAAAVVVLAIGAAAMAVTSDDGGQHVIATDVPTTTTTIDPGSCSPAPVGPAAEPPPATIAAFVHGAPDASPTSSPAAVGDLRPQVPEVIARVRVLGSQWGLGSTSNSDDDVAWVHVVDVEVLDAVTGAADGERLTIADRPSVAPRPLASADRYRTERTAAQEQVAEVQQAVDDAWRPVADADAAAQALDPSTPDGAAARAHADELRRQVEAQVSALQGELADAAQRVHLVDVAEDQGISFRPPPMAPGPPCHEFEVGDQLIVAAAPTRFPPVVNLASPSSFLLIDGNGFSEDLDAARRSVPRWGDSELLRLARGSTPDQFLDRLRAATN